MKKTALRTVSTLMLICMLLSSTVSAYELDPDAEPGVRSGEALYMENAPVIDGYYSAEEWGEGMTYTFTAAENADDNVMVQCTNSGFLDNLSGWKADICLRWDEDYLYAAVLTNDPDVHAQGYFDRNIISKDSFEMTVDPEGYMDFNLEGAADIAAAYSVSAGKSSLWNMKADKDIISVTKEKSAPAAVCVAPAGCSYTDDTENGITTYEIALPWETVFSGYLDTSGAPITSLKYTEYKGGRRADPTAAIGRSFGFTASVFNSSESGIGSRDALCFGIRRENWVLTENALFLSGEKAVQSESFETFDPADIFIPSSYNNTIDEAGVYYDYLAGDTEEITPVTYEELTTLTYEQDEDYFDWGIDSMEPLECVKKYEDDEHGYVLATNFDDKYFVTRLTSGFGENYGRFPMSYTVEFDVKYNGGTGSCFGSNFGGLLGIECCCAYYPAKGQFRLVKGGAYGAADTVLAFCEKEMSAGEWYHWKFQYDTISKTVRFYIDDGEEENLIFDISGINLFVSCENYGAVSFVTGDYDMCLDNVKIYNFSDFSNDTTELKGITAGYINCDRKLNAVDALMERNIIVGKENFGQVNHQAADINFDSKINVSDSLLIRRRITGIY